MNAGVFNIDGSGPEHQAVQELLPWYAADRLSSDESGRVARHLQHCIACRRDLARERALLAAANDDEVLPPGLDMDAALARLMPQLGAQDQSGDASDTDNTSPPAPPVASPAVVPLRATLPWWRRTAANEPSWLRWAAVAQCVVIVGMAALLARPDAADTASLSAYHALGNGAAPSGGNLVVIFEPATTEREFRRILQRHGARVVDGPTVTDAYLLRVADTERQRALEALRHDPAVRLAEALDENGTP